MIEALEVRERLSSGLAVLRALSRALVAIARAAQRDEAQRRYVRDVIEQLSFEMDRHFSYEEKNVVPLLRDVDAWGPVRVDRLIREHEEQRELLLALAEDAMDEGTDVVNLAEEIVWFNRRFEERMYDEEQLLYAESIGAEPYVDQIDG